MRGTIKGVSSYLYLSLHPSSPMRILLQRVLSASVTINNHQTAAIGPGLLLLVGFGRADAKNGPGILDRAARKIVNLRIFANDQGKLDHSVASIEGGLLVIPQFTLYGKSEKGRRPDFTEALAPSAAAALFDTFQAALERELMRPVLAGVFGAEMQVQLVNQGPFTLSFEF